jgi:NitT/TauT family transport system ATP-binding protein
VTSAADGTIPLLEADDITRDFEAHGQTTSVLAGIGFAVWPGEFVSVVGPSGCGKTTLVRILAGLISAGSGEARVGGHVVHGPPRGLLLLFQQYEKSLLPWRSVAGNVQFALVNQHLPRAEQQHRIIEALKAVDLEEFAAYYPYQLSGGMQQRVALARALACRPQILLMDEPFSSVDALTRGDLQDLTLRLWEERRQTILLVTHDVDEAVYLSSRILVLSRRPARLQAEVSVELPYPRDQVSTREEPAFLHARRQIYSTIRGPTRYPEVDAHWPVRA